MMDYTVLLGTKNGVRALFAIIAAIPPLMLVAVLIDALYRMKGSGGAKYSLSTNQVVVQLLGIVLYAISDIVIWCAPISDVKTFQYCLTIYFVFLGTSQVILLITIA
jgi:hypothetical protein